MVAFSVECARIQTSEELLKAVRSPSDLTSAGWTGLHYCNVKHSYCLLLPSALADSPDTQNVPGHTGTHRSLAHTSQNKPLIGIKNNRLKVLIRPHRTLGNTARNIKSRYMSLQFLQLLLGRARDQFEYIFQSKVSGQYRNI